MSAVEGTNRKLSNEDVLTIQANFKKREELQCYFRSLSRAAQHTSEGRQVLKRIESLSNKSLGTEFMVNPNTIRRNIGRVI